jgi:tRNA pseudouridine55 synthase
MSRRRNGRQIDGWLVIDKPAGPTSNDVLIALRRALDARKAGHAGTLDPAATGVLPIAFGTATKTIPHVSDGTKSYRFTVNWGAETSTDDAAGTPVATSAVRPSPAAIAAALPAFRGPILQVPPRVSAVKVEGARAYDLAREGAAFDLRARPLLVSRLEMVDCTTDSASFAMTCGKGGYVRSIARDLGRLLGCLGHVDHLRRDRSGPFAIGDAIPLDMALARAAGGTLLSSLLPPEAALSGLPKVSVSATDAALIRQGRAVPAEPGAADADAAWATAAGRAVALGRVADGLFHPRRILDA